MSNVLTFRRPKRPEKRVRTTSKAHEIVAQVLVEGFFRRWAVDPLVVTDDNAVRRLSAMRLEDQYTIVEGLERAAEVEPATCCLHALMWIPDTTRGEYMQLRLCPDLLRKCGRRCPVGGIRIPAEDSSPPYDLDYVIVEECRGSHG